MLWNDFEPEACQEALRRICRDLAFEVAGVRPPRGDDALLSQLEQEQLSEEYERNVQRQIDSRHFSTEFRQFALSRLNVHDLGGSALPAHIVNELLEGVGRAVVEQQRRYRHQVRNAVLPYIPSDQLFSSPPALAAVDAPQADGIGPSFAEAIEAFCKSHEQKWTPKTLVTHRAKLNLLISCFGADRRIATVTTPELWGFLEGVQRLRRNHHVTPAPTFLSRQTSAPEACITAVTVTNILARVKSLFRWARQRGYRGDNPAEFLAVSIPKQKKGVKSRRSFKPAELTQIFSSPLFSGCKSATRRFEAGPSILKDAYYWLPLMSFYTGARLGELVQLRLDDLIIESDAPHISINENGSAEAEKKHVKTEAGVRLVPLHPQLLELGFAEFVANRRKVKGKRVRLFWEIAYGADGQASSTFSKWWGRAMDRMGLSDPALTHHSFRHTAEDTFRSSQVPKYIIDQLMGHRDPSTAGEYGTGVDVHTAYKIVSGLNLPISVVAVLAQPPVIVA